MPSVSLPVALGATAVAGVAGSVISGGAAKSAADAQVQGEQQATAAMQQQYQQTRADLLPYNQQGQAANAQISGMGPFSFAPTEAQLEATPGYQFTLNQGLKATQNGYAARGLPVSGAAMKGAASYATGLADTTYQNQFSNALNTYQTNLGKLQNQANLGENAASQTGAFGTATANSIGQAAVGAANAQAQGAIGTANAATSGLNSVSGAFLNNAFLSQNGGLYGGGAGFASAPGFASQTGAFGAVPDSFAGLY